MAKRQKAPDIRLGTCSWSTQDWVGRVYAPGTPATEFIAQYAQRFNTVEIDATFYAVPRTSTVDGWRDRTPDGFLFSAKVPQAITHEKFLEDCSRELDAFLKAMARLDGKRTLAEVESFLNEPAKWSSAHGGIAEFSSAAQ